MIDTCRSKAAFTRDDQRECAQLAPQTITRNGKPSLVVVSAEERLTKTTHRGSLEEFLSASPYAAPTWIPRDKTTSPVTCP